jgi:vancomycin aglycone glucosyltransferase
MAGLAVQLRALGAEVRVCAPPDEEFVELLAGVGVPMVPFGKAWRSWVRPSAAEERTRRVAEFIDAQYDTVAEAAEECDVLLATAMSHFLAQSVAEKVGIPHRYATFAPNVLKDPDAQSWNALFGPPINAHRASIDLPPVDDVFEFMFTDHPWLVADQTLGPWQEPADVAVMQTAAWILPDERPLPGELVWPRDCCSTRSAEKGRQRPRDHPGSSSQGNCPAPGCTANSACSESRSCLAYAVLLDKRLARCICFGQRR